MARDQGIMRSSRSIIIGLVLLVVLALLVLLTSFIPFAAPAGSGDFQAYWSASYLLARSQNFADLDLLLRVEQMQTGWNQDYVMTTWNPPWLLALLLPYALVPFQQAAWLWLFTNIGLIFAASLLAWRVFCATEHGGRREWIALALAFLFVPALLAIFVGQVNTLAYFGLAGFLFFYTRKKPLLAGVILSMTLVKPHLVYVTLPLILLMAARERRWRVWWGVGGAIIFLTGIVFILRPMFIQDYSNSVTAGRLLDWQTPTLGGILTVLFGWSWSKWMGTAVLPLTLGLWYWRSDLFPFLTWFNGTLLLSVITAPFGWGYDAIVLILPILQMMSWGIEGQLARRDMMLLITFFLAIDLLLFRLRWQGINEVYYFWLPIAIAGLYIWTQVSRKTAARQWQLST